MRKSNTTNVDLLQQMGYEPRDINIRQVWIACVALLGFFVVTMGAVALIYAVFIPDWAKLGRMEPLPPNRRLPPHPQLQVDPRRDFELYRQAEDRNLEGKALDGKTPEGIPVDQAIEQLATQRGIAGVTGTAVRERGNSYPGAYSKQGEERASGQVSGPSGQANEVHGGLDTNDGSSTEAAEDAGHGASQPGHTPAEHGGH